MSSEKRVVFNKAEFFVFRIEKYDSVEFVKSVIPKPNSLS